MPAERNTGQMAPRTINVHKFAEARASEIESLHSIVAQRLDNNFRSRRNKRRRTTAHDNLAKNRRRSKRQKVTQCDDPKVEIGAKLPRFIRRRIELKMNSQSGFATSGDGTKRLRTHVWHAKRFTMTKLWGFHLPLGLHGRGRGSRALLKRYKEGVVVHDASYHLAVQLEGPQDSLVSILKMVMVSSSGGHPLHMSPSALRGSTYQTAMLHNVGEPTGPPICPIIYIWRALSEQNVDNSASDCSANGHTQPQDSEASKRFRQLWVWLHASSFSEGFNALKSACEKEMNTRRTSINFFSVEGRIAKLEVMGSGASKLLEKILNPVSCVPGTSFQLKNHSEAIYDDMTENHIFLKEVQFSDCMVLNLVVRDPRVNKEESVGSDIQSAPSKADFTEPVQVEEHIPVSISSDKDRGEPSSSPVNSETEDLWDSSREIKLPLEESVLCQEKHDRRMEFFCLNDLPRPSSPLNATRSSMCPIMLLRKHSSQYPFMGWSIILPLSWLKSFWIPLVSKGAQALGLREKRWISCEAGMPYFPSDFPDCSAYSSLMASESSVVSAKADLRPPKLRLMKVPIPSPWSSVKPAYTDIPLGREIYSMRTSHELDLFKESFGGHLLLYPHVAGKEDRLAKALKDETGPYQEGEKNVKCGGKLLFLRVSLRAFKEGSFEEGAVVCAPQFSDISLWTLRPQNEGNGLRISEAAVASYFQEESLGTWVLQTPEDLLERESHRRAIGFVTSGFVRGSKKPTAVAFCEVTSLAQLRAEQWSAVSAKRRKKEIYVLVRNLRSSAYRLALASIILEHQVDDVESM